MKEKLKKLFIWASIFTALLIILAFITDVFIMPWYVDKEEVVVPNFVGIHKDSTESIAKEHSLQVIFEGPRYSDNYPENYILFQKPSSGSIVKENRNIYLVVSGGNPLTKIPDLYGKSVRDAKVSIERLGFVLDGVDEVESEEEAGIVVEQYPKAGTNLELGTKVKLKVSVGPRIGMVRVPDLLGLSYEEAKETLERNSLVVGKINYQQSKNLLPNTIVAQYPAKNKLLKVGEKVDLFITKNIN